MTGPARLLAGAAALLVASCAVGATTRPAASPLLDLDCAMPARPPAPLPKLRTVDALRTWAEATERARVADAANLVTCRDRLFLLEAWARDLLTRR